MSDSEDEVFCGPITLREMKIIFSKPPVKRSERRNTTIGFSEPPVLPKLPIINKPFQLSNKMEGDKENLPSNFINEVTKTLFKDNEIPAIKIIDEDFSSPVDLSNAVLELHKEIDGKIRESTEQYLSAYSDESSNYLSIKTEIESSKDVLVEYPNSLTEENTKIIDTIEILDDSIEEVKANYKRQPKVLVTRPTFCFDETLDYEDVHEISDDEYPNDQIEKCSKMADSLLLQVCDAEEMVDNLDLQISKFPYSRISVADLIEHTNLEEMQKKYVEISEKCQQLAEEIGNQKTENNTVHRKSQVSEKFADSLEQSLASNNEEIVMSQDKLNENLPKSDETNVNDEENPISTNFSLEKLLDNESFDNCVIRNEIDCLIDNLLLSDDEDAQMNLKEPKKDSSTLSQSIDQSKDSSYKFDDTLEEMDMFMQEMAKQKETDKSKQQSVHISEEIEDSIDFSKSEDISEVSMTKAAIAADEDKENNDSAHFYSASEHIQLNDDQNSHRPVKQFFKTPGKNRPVPSHHTPSSQNAPTRKYFATPSHWQSSPTATKTAPQFKVPPQPMPKSCTKDKSASPYRNVMSPIGIYIKTNPVPAFVRADVRKDTVQRWEPLPDHAVPRCPSDALETSGGASPSATVKTPNSGKKVVELPVRFYRPPAKQVLLFKEEETKLPASVQKLVKGTLKSEVKKHEKRVNADGETTSSSSSSSSASNDRVYSLFNDTANMSHSSADISLLISTRGVKHY